MDDLLDEPIREGNRGGQGLFKWDDVKADKQREHYLGSSIHANIGRWQRNRVLLWYDKEKNERTATQDDVQQELETVKSAEADALAEALGLHGPKNLSQRLARGGGISQHELKSIIKKEVEGKQEAEEPFKKGSGFGYQQAMQAVATSSNATAIKESSKSKKDKKKKKKKRSKRDASSDSSRGSRQSASPRSKRVHSDDEPHRKSRHRSRSREHRRRSPSPSPRRKSRHDSNDRDRSRR